MKPPQDPIDIIKLQANSLENIQLYMMQMRDLNGKMLECYGSIHSMFTDLDARLSKLESDFVELRSDLRGQRKD
ncbi:hypothetical protein ACQKP1_25570 [Allorhizobium sp. NPDC080224]|uniref:hypothetical protein n=1 Tax=Allorhizobium sp. NPDC080224 TaxID=3390547 RepID=UPI003D063D17